MIKNLLVLDDRRRDTSLLELSDDVDQGMILEKWKFQEILKEIASCTKAKERPLAEA